MKVRVDDIEVNVEVRGEGHPLVLLHGWACNTLLWEPQGELAGGLKLIAMDQRGHGQTPCPVTDRSFDTPLDVIQVMDQLGIEKAFYCGLSMGGPLALQLALDYPERCLGVVLLATGPGAPDPAGPKTREMKEEAEREAWRVAERGVVEYFFSKGVATAPGVREFLDVPEQRAFFERMLAHNNPEYFADLVRRTAMDRPPALARYSTSRRTERLGELQMPVLLMLGSQDATFLPVADYLKPRISRCEVEIISGATHLINVDGKDAVNRAIRGFVERVMA